MKLPKHASFSSLTKMETCPLCWWLGYIENIWPPKSKALKLGQQVHDWIYSYIRNPDKDQSLEALQYVKPFEKIYPKPTILVIEQEFKIPFVNPTTQEKFPVPIKGFIDWIDEDDWVHDIKTSSRRYDSFRIDTDHQLTLYAYAFRYLYKRIEKGVRFDVLVKNVKPVCIPYSGCRTSEDIEKTWNWAMDIWWQIERMLKDGKPKKHTEKCWTPDFEREVIK